MQSEVMDCHVAGAPRNDGHFRNDESNSRHCERSEAIHEVRDLGLDLTVRIELSILYRLASLRSSAMITVSSMEAQNRFGQLLDTVQREPVTITRHGRAAAFIISPRDMQDLQDARRKRSAAVEALEAWSQKALASALPGAASLTDEQVVEMVKALR
jgi:prevent-host-death family protein